MSYELEKHLIEMDILPANSVDELGDLIEPYVTECNDYFNDPSDPITCGVPF